MKTKLQSTSGGRHGKLESGGKMELLTTDIINPFYSVNARIAKVLSSMCPLDSKMKIET